MTLQNSAAYQSLVNTPWFSRIRRNHGLEHATLHVLSKRFSGKNLAGHSDTRGFWLLGDVPTEEVESAVSEALERLKGGEKALAAAALLFSLYMIRPSPFCILDEVDAPLDEANIDRFIQVLKEISQESQIIMVTHNKRTMEISDLLLGVTMEEPGISKIMSVNLQDIPETHG